ncbi:PREDICTED: MAPK/MAK/MRK overlapping kinase [Dipodomys ordii]|uniref:MAPK/MAK/MRK overlapping kinase n=1 Tax=Dipodomys ordii TaxID=10020 RepID=A0A1S3EWZ4_DIPOR|nr:PREDICTED: MAPK/MAK/MRK overlapping kinase [Dipodomys ordii]
MKNYKAIGKIGEGTFSEVMKMQSLKDGNYYACKQMKQHFDSIDQVNSLREIQALRRLNPHPNILTLYEVVLRRWDRRAQKLWSVHCILEHQLLFLAGAATESRPGEPVLRVRLCCVCGCAACAAELRVRLCCVCRRAACATGLCGPGSVQSRSPPVALCSALASLSSVRRVLQGRHVGAGRRHPLSERRIMHYMYQLCKSLDHMHRNGIFHRDVKPENILIKQDVLKLGDFGSCRSVYSKQPYTEYISTRWYRAPECLLTDGFYTYKMDLWSAGCVFYEIASLQPLFPGDNELDQISKIHDVIGTPAQRTLTKFKQSRAMSFDFPFKKGSGIPPPPTNLSPHCLSLLHAMVVYDPDDRIAAHQALQHPYFQEQRGAEARALVSHRRAFFPT